ncbi:ATP-dependent DNA helicase RecG [Legionella sp. W05-934-2]|jgi:ATP-dependent DNA helicase RecG|uniref:ATP-dependent DNA helicase RecG n=1 Tax=Legionella sp. W05-934-2 TaxID=1198649 RepID=UPI0034637D10
MTLNDSCETLPGVGPSLAKKLSQCGIATIADMIFHLPFRYQDRTRVTPIADCIEHDYAVVAGEVISTDVSIKRKRILNCYIQDMTDSMRLRFFHFNQSQIQGMNTCYRIVAFGEVRRFGGQLEMIHPEYQLLKEGDPLHVEEHLTPIYHTTQGLAQRRLRQLIESALTTAKPFLSQLEWMTEKQLQELQFPSMDEAIMLLHHPPPDIALHDMEENTHPAFQRLAFDELLAQQVSMRFARQHMQAIQAHPIPENADAKSRLLAQLPFQLTKAQMRVIEDIELDMNLPVPMLRLVQGDVGSGKTVVAAAAAMQAISQGFQVAIMAPTDILSEQHSKNMQQWFEPLGIPCLRLSGKMKVSERRPVLAALASGEGQLVVGTHALFQEEVVFQRLGLVIIDEQHRFGVTQRLKLQQKGAENDYMPHQLLMTATPIPRTLAMTQFAHLDLSIIDEMPPGRTPITTSVLNQDKRDQIVARLDDALANNRQAYWVCTLIEESEKLQCQAASDTAESLQQLLPSHRVGLVHGRLKVEEKEAVMAAFKAGDIQLLVATTVIEVGVDVPNASLMIIENAERLGLSQLHQLRGRVGRGATESYCMLLYQPPLSDVGHERLKTMRATCDGFEIAETDLKLRGGGEFLGARQTGYRQFKLVDLQRDGYLLPKVKQMAYQLMESNPALAKRIAHRWMGDFERYIQA